MNEGALTTFCAPNINFSMDIVTFGNDTDGWTQMGGFRVNATHHYRGNKAVEFRQNRKLRMGEWGSSHLMPAKCANLFNLNHMWRITTTALSLTTYHRLHSGGVHSSYLGGLNAISGHSNNTACVILK